MSAPSTAIRTAVDTVLRADAGVVAAFAPSNVRLYPLAAPANPTFPYVIFRTEVIGDDTECADGAEVTVTLDVYARSRTYAESVARAEGIAHAVRKALTNNISVAGHVVDDWTFLFDRPVGDPDILTEHRSIAVTYLTTADE